MEIASVSECLNKIDNRIFNKDIKGNIRSDLEDLGTHIEWKQADVVASDEEGDEQTIAVLSVLFGVNNMIEKYYADELDSLNEYLDGPCKKLRQKFLEWYCVITNKDKKNRQ